MLSTQVLCCEQVLLPPSWPPQNWRQESPTSTRVALLSYLVSTSSKENISLGIPESPVTYPGHVQPDTGAPSQYCSPQSSPALGLSGHVSMLEAASVLRHVSQESSHWGHSVL